MARIPLEHRRTVKVRLLEFYSRRRYGKVLEPGLAALHQPQVLRAMVSNEAKAARWNMANPTHKALAVMAAAAQIECSWCMDFGYWEYHHQGVPENKLREINTWQTSDAYTDTERAVIGYAVAMTQTPLAVTDEMVARLLQDMSVAELVELTAMVALENQRSRLNSALGLTSQGFKDSCELRSAGGPAESEQRSEASATLQPTAGRAD